MQQGSSPFPLTNPVLLQAPQRDTSGEISKALGSPYGKLWGTDTSKLKEGVTGFSLTDVSEPCVLPHRYRPRW